jgi:hypothetical protein
MSGYFAHVVAYVLVASAMTFILLHYSLISADKFTVAISLGIGLVYTFLPDIDLPSSRARRILGKTLLGVSLASLLGFLAGVFDEKAVYLAVGLNLFLYVLWYVKHRGILHTLAAGAVSSASLALVKPVYALYAFVGYATHLALDGEVFK